MVAALLLAQQADQVTVQGKNDISSDLELGLRRGIGHQLLCMLRGWLVSLILA